MASLASLSTRRRDGKSLTGSALGAKKRKKWQDPPGFCMVQPSILEDLEGGTAECEVFDTEYFPLRGLL